MHHALHVALCGLPARHGQGHEDVPQPPSSWLVCSCLWSPRSGMVGLCPAGQPCRPCSPSTPALLLLRGSLPFLQPDRRLLQQSNIQEKGSIYFAYVIYGPEPFRLGREQAQRAVCIPTTSIQYFYRYSLQHWRTRAVRKKHCSTVVTR